MNASRASHVPPAAKVLPGRVFYGWYVTLACGLMMWVTVGVGYYGLSTFLRPLQDEHGWSAGVVSGATGLYFTVSGVSAFIVGPFIDRRGPIRVMTVGILLTALSAAAVGFVQSIWQLYAVYSCMALAFGMGAAVATGSIMSRWFIHHRAKAISISSTGVSLGGATLVPLGTWLIGEGGLRLGAPVLGALVAAVALPVLYLVVSPDPAEMGLQADGHGGPDGVRLEHRSRVRLETQYRTWTRREAVSTWSFWAILIGFAFALATQTAVLIHQLSFLQEPGKLGSSSTAALAVTTTTIGSIVARLVVGQFFADKADKRLMTVVLFVGQAAAVFLYTMVSGTFAIYGVAMLFGFTIGNVYMMQSLLTAEIFGMSPSAPSTASWLSPARSAAASASCSWAGRATRPTATRCLSPCWRR
ncbi:MAG: MFS transporter [Acidimicrobiia bacterium]|nr:MFS transporter [Acidimicrobiia bacterium]